MAIGRKCVIVFGGLCYSVSLLSCSSGRAIVRIRREGEIERDRGRECAS